VFEALTIAAVISFPRDVSPEIRTVAGKEILRVTRRIGREVA